jgi:hypothetical protein
LEQLQADIIAGKIKTKPQEKASRTFHAQGFVDGKRPRSFNRV